MLSPLPRRSDWGHCFAHSPQSCQPSPIWLSGRPAHRPFRGLLGVHSRCGLHTRAVTVFRDTLSEGFSYFVTSIAAPVASGWSVRRVGFAPTGKRRLLTAHTHSVGDRTLRRQSEGSGARFGRPLLSGAAVSCLHRGALRIYGRGNAVANTGTTPWQLRDSERMIVGNAEL